MRAIRRVNPHARLIQTDDLGHCHATPPLQHSADFQNERRWIGWDLLCGTVVPGHALWDRVVDHGFEDRLRAIADDPSPPDVIGINHYLSSERLIDHRIELHEGRSRADGPLGRTDGIVHVNVDAVRSWRDGVIGLPGLLEQAWARYRRPIAVTECHNGTARCEQVRWFVEVWNQVADLRQRGVDVRAVTAWALLGSHDWNRMLTRFDGHYEVGVFDVRGGTPRPTLMASVLRDLAAGRQPDAPPLCAPGAWRKPHPESPRPSVAAARGHGARPLLIAGDAGRLTELAVEACERRHLPYLRHDGDIDTRLVRKKEPWAVFDTRDNDGLFGQGATAPLFNHWKADRLAEACGALAIPGALLTDIARVGRPPCPARLLHAKTVALYGPDDRDARASRMLDALDGGEPIYVDEGTPWREAYGPDVIDGVLDLLLDKAHGPVAFVVAKPVTEADFARELAAASGADPGLVRARGSRGPGATATNALSFLPALASTLERFVRERRMARGREEPVSVPDAEPQAIAAE